MVTATADAEASPDGMTMEQMIAMKEGLEAQIKAAMSKPTTDKVNSVGRFSAAVNRQSGIEEEEPPQRRLSVGQMYKVIAKFVAVRAAPSLQAPFLRRLNQGTKVEMFEWDSSRRWRRVSVECATVPDTKAQPRLTEAQRLWASDPHWDNVRGCWVDRSHKVEVVDEDLVVEKDGWVLVQHPDLGLLLQAVGGEEEEVAEVNTAGQTTELPRATLQPTSKEETFDYYWGSSTKKPIVFQAPRSLPLRATVEEAAAVGESPDYLQPQQPSVLGESSIAEAMLSAVDGVSDEDADEDEDANEAQLVEEQQSQLPEEQQRSVEATRYRVVYKKVAVRKEPNTKSEALRQLPQGEIVEMYEWDATHCWRRIRILAIREATEGGGMQETDGWMLIESPNVGRLLEEVVEEVTGDNDDEDDFAG